MSLPLVLKLLVFVTTSLLLSNEADFVEIVDVVFEVSQVVLYLVKDSDIGRVAVKVRWAPLGYAL